MTYPTSPKPPFHVSLHVITILPDKCVTSLSTLSPKSSIALQSNTSSLFPIHRRHQPRCGRVGRKCLFMDASHTEPDPLNIAAGKKSSRLRRENSSSPLREITILQHFTGKFPEHEETTSIGFGSVSQNGNHREPRQRGAPTM